MLMGHSSGIILQAIEVGREILHWIEKLERTRVRWFIFGLYIEIQFALLQQPYKKLGARVTEFKLHSDPWPTETVKKHLSLL